MNGETHRIELAATRVLPAYSASGGKTKLTEVQLRKRSAPFFRLFECVYDAVFITTAQGTVVECNERACDFFRTTADVLLGRSFVSFVSGANDSLILQANQNLDEHRFTLVDGHCKRLDGTSFPAEIAISRIELRSAPHLCFFVRDVTIRRQAQEELKNAVERLQEHDRARMEFVSNVSHELRTPLTSMIYAVGNMLRGVVGPLPEKAFRYLERLQSDCRRLLATVNDILDLRQVENNALVLSKTLNPLRLIAEEALHTLDVQAEAKHQHLSFETGDRELFALCDAPKMERVVLNVVGNAIKFTPPGGTIRISLSANGSTGEIACRDDGPGIPPDKLPKISRRYFRAGETVCGSGLGLAISREIVELHGGSMHFASPVPGTSTGTEVSVAIPLVAPPVVALFRFGDDEASQSLQNAGWTPCRVSSFTGVEALENVRLVLLQTGAKSEDEEFCLRLRESVRLKRVPAAVLPARPLSGAAREFFKQFNVVVLSVGTKGKSLSDALAKIVAGK